jgi:hypothetical protein
MTRGKTLGVWCTRYPTNLLPTDAAINNHFRRNHAFTPTAEEIRAVLRNVLSEKEHQDRVLKLLPRKFKRLHKARGLPRGSGRDHTDQHEARWRRHTGGSSWPWQEEKVTPLGACGDGQSTAGFDRLCAQRYGGEPGAGSPQAIRQ